jgi:hypothetical protein
LAKTPSSLCARFPLKVPSPSKPPTPCKQSRQHPHSLSKLLSTKLLSNCLFCYV